VKRRIALGATVAFAVLVAPATQAADSQSLQPSAGFVLCNTMATTVTASVSFGTLAGYRQAISAGACAHISVPPDLKSPVTVTGSDSTGRVFRPLRILLNGRVQSLRLGPCTNGSTDLCFNVATSPTPMVSPRTP
jgi:hypothetical protein